MLVARYWIKKKEIREKIENLKIKMGSGRDKNWIYLNKG